MKARPKNPGQTGVGGDIERHRRNVQRHGQMGQAGINPHGSPCTGKQGSQLGNTHRRRSKRAWNTGRKAPSPLTLDSAATGQNDTETKAVQMLTESQPAGLRPQFVVATGRRQENDIGTMGQPGKSTRHRLDSIICFAICDIAQSRRRQTPVAYDRVQFARHMKTTVVKTGSHRLAYRISGITQMWTMCLASEQSALQQPLRIDDSIVAPSGYLPAKSADFLPGWRLQEVFAPATNRHGNHLMERRMQARDAGKAILDAPVDLSLGKMAANIADHRQVVDNVAERGSFHEQNAHRRIKSRLSKLQL